MQIALIFNPAAGRSRPKSEQLPQLLSWFEAIGYQAVPHPTQWTGHGTELARKSRGRFDAIAAWGGDGTLNEVAAGLIGSTTPVLVLPGGTVNVFARECGIPLRLERAVRALPSYEARAIPVGLANDRPFLLMAGVGLDAEVVCQLERNDSDLKARLGVRAFIYEGWRQWRRFRFAPINVVREADSITASSLVAGNLRRYAHRFFVTPDARLDERALDVVAFTGGSRWTFMRYLAGIVGGFHTRLPDVEHWKCDEIQLTMARETDGPLHYHVDGEPAGQLPLTISVAKEPLQVFLPKDP